MSLSDLMHRIVPALEGRELTRRRFLYVSGLGAGALISGCSDEAVRQPGRPEQPEPVLFSDGFEGNNLTGWDNIDFLGRPSEYPQVYDGIIRGIGSGYHDGVTAKMSKKIDIDASNGFVFNIRAVSGSSTPNQAAWSLFSSFHPDPYECYKMRIYGEGNKRIDFFRLAEGFEEQLGQLYLGSSIHEWHDYRLERDALGNWALAIDKIDQNINFKPDNQLKHFNHIQLDLLKAGSQIDYLQVKSLA